MRKILLLVISIFLIAGCAQEPMDREVISSPDAPAALRYLLGLRHRPGRVYRYGVAVSDWAAICPDHPGAGHSLV